MFPTKLGFAVIGFILSSGVLGRTDRICALKGTSEVLTCSAKPSSTTIWYKLVGSGWTEVSGNGTGGKYKISKDYLTLSVMDLTKEDSGYYCCTDKAGNPPEDLIDLVVTALQVRVFPTNDGETVTLMCSSTSCALSEKPADYIWYKNAEVLYQDWSPWYQEMVPSDTADGYSCAIKGHEGLRAPAVTVESVSPTCYTVSYSQGRMCLYNQTTVKGPCSIMYPTEIYVGKEPGDKDHVSLRCVTSCPPTITEWYKNNKIHEGKLPPVPKTSPDNFLCAVRAFKDLQSVEGCFNEESCWVFNYIKNRICALEGSSVNISSTYSHPDYTKSKPWSRIIWNGGKERVDTREDDFEYHEDKEKHIHTLTIKSVKQSDSAEYIFSHSYDDGTRKPGVILIVTGVKVKFSPSAEVTEGQRVNVTCSTSCPLTNNKNYTWYLNGDPLQQPEHQNKHLLLDPVRRQQAGNYSCSLNTQRHTRSPENTLVVRSHSSIRTLAAATGGAAALLVLIGLAVMCWIRKRKLSQNNVLNLEEISPGPVYEEITDHPTEKTDNYYSSVFLPKSDMNPLYNTVQPHQHQQQKHSPYAVVSLSNHCG